MTPVKLTTTEETLKAATRVLLEERAPLEAIALETRVGRSQLGTYQSRASSLFMPIDILARLFELRREEAAVRGSTDAPALLVELARCAGFGLVPMQKASGEDLLACLAEWSREVSDVHAAVLDALRDGKICAEDAARIEAETMDMLGDAKRLLGALRARVQDAADRGGQQAA